MSIRINQDIVVFMPRYLGDCINCTPALQMLKEYYPDSVIHLVIREPAATVLSQIERIVCIIDPRVKSKIKGQFVLIKQLKQVRARACVLMTNTLVDAVVAKVAGIEVLAGYKAEIRGALLSHSLKLDRNRHYINRYAYLANLICNNSFKTLYPVAIPFDEKNSTSYLENKINVGICIVSKAKLSRHYPVDQTAAVIEQLTAQFPDIWFFMLGTDEEANEAEQVVKLCHQAKLVNIESLAGKTTVLELIDNIAAFDLLITVDSGPLHIAAATGTTTIALHSKGTSPFSTVCPKQTNIHVVNSNGGFIDDNDQVLDLMPSKIVETASTILVNRHK